MMVQDNEQLEAALYHIAVFGRWRSRTDCQIATLKVYGKSEEQARYRAKRLVSECGHTPDRTEILEKGCDDYGEGESQ